MLPVSAMAQGAFSHLGIGVEAGTTGVGVSLSAPLVHRHLYLSLGVNFPNVTVKRDIGFDAETVNEKYREMNRKIDIFNEYFPSQAYDHIDYLDDEVMVDATFKLNMQTYKVMLEYYPSANSTFHITTGVFIGSSEILSAQGKVDEQSWASYQQAIEYNRMVREAEALFGVSGYHVEGLEESLSYNVGEQTFRIDPASDGSVDAAITLSKVRPYLGIGFGRSVPVLHRVGFQFEIGAWYHGNPKLSSSNEVAYDPSVEQRLDLDEKLLDAAHSLQFYPQITFRLTGRIF